MKIRIVLIVIIMLFSLLCNSCKDKHVHEYVNGKCECGEIDSNYTPPHEHVFYDVIVDPTCIVDGAVYSSCDCGYSKTTTIPATGHSFIDGICSCGEKEEINVTYVVVFKDIDGNILKEEKVVGGFPATPPDAPIIEGYTFVGWDSSFDNITSDLEVRALYKKKEESHTHEFIDGVCNCGELEETIVTYTVTFKDYDGKILATITIKEGESVTPPNDPVRDGYLFIGWDQELENITSNLVVNAKYYEEKVYYNISYVIDDSLWYYDSKEEMVLDFLNDFYDFVKPSESRVAFIYGGTTYDATWINYIGGSVGYVNYLIYNNDIELSNDDYFFNSTVYKSKWYKLSSYVKNEICEKNKRFGYPDVNYLHGALDFKRYIENDPEGYVSSYGGANVFYGYPKNDATKPTSYTTDSIDIILPIPTSRKFIGWYNNAEFTGEPLEKIKSGSSGDVVLYAKVSDEKFEVAFDTGFDLKLDDIITCKNGLVNLPVISRTGYTFLGWYLDYDLISNNFTYEYDVSIKLTAKWQENGKPAMTNLLNDGKIVTYRNSFVAVEIPTEYVEKTVELRAVWVSSFINSFTPSTDQTLMKESLTEVLDLMEYYNMNCMIFHIRTHNNAFYKTILAPIDSKYGTYESFGSWDYLTWLIDECHKRGIEFHAWFNPYRIALSGIKLDATTMDVAKDYIDYPLNPASNPDNILLTYVSTNRSLGAILNPAKSVVQDYLVDVCMEVVKNYNVDAIHFDDYFYQRLNSDDTAILKDADQKDYIEYINNNKTSFKVDSLSDKQAWRRYNIDCLIEKIHNALSKYNKENGRSVEFGISPTGTYKSGDGSVSSGANTTPIGHYNAPIFCDTYKWIKEGWIDYIMPQCYTSFDYVNYSFHDSTIWWNKAVEGTNVDLYIGISLSTVYDEDYEYGWKTNPYELNNQLLYLNTLDNVKGVGVFSFTTIKQLHNDKNFGSYVALKKLKTEYWTKKISSR